MHYRPVPERCRVLGRHSDRALMTGIGVLDDEIWFTTE